ncbi:MAG: histidine kinase [Acidobacteria bacterium]|nr:histidine kinase [Acidobacteriota bacterium]
MSLNPPTAERILVLAPTGRDAALAVTALQQAGFTCQSCRDMDELCRRIEEAAGAVMITEEALTTNSMPCLAEVLERQAPWSDLPLLVFTSQPALDLGPRSFERIGSRANVTLVERPIRVKTLISAVETALRARRRQYEVRELLRELERRIDERDTFLAMLSHELRNPLAAITLAVDELERRGPPELKNERAVVIRQTRQLTKLVDDLLDIARVTSGKIRLHRSDIDLGDIVEHCATTAIHRAKARGVTLTMHPVAEPAFVHGDPVRMEQIVSNVISNAIKYTPSGGAIDVYIEKDETDAIFRVRDTGRGIAPEMLTRIFDIFMQSDVTIDRADGGMGIGLTLVQKLVELHGGNVRAYSGGKGCGSEFVIRLPLLVEAPVLVPATKQPERDANVAARHIVIVEDNPDIRELLRAKLRHLGHRVDVAEDGVHGVETIVAERPDLALVDIGLPGLDGYQVAQRVREEIGDDVHLVALTGYGQAEDRKKALDAGFNVHLTKPADIADVQNVIGDLPMRKAPPA